jgi:DNA primase
MSGLIPQHFIDDLIARADIVDVLSKRIDLKKAGKEFKAVCPFHNDKNPSLTISPLKGFYHCFSCGAHGTALGFIMEYENLNFVEAVESLASELGVEVPYENRGNPTEKNDDLFPLMDAIQKKFQNNLKDNAKAIQYLKKRGIDGKTAKKYKIGYAEKGWSNILDNFGSTDSNIKTLLKLGLIIKKDNNKGYYDRFRDRIIFPIRDSRGRFIGFGGRIFEGDQPKYLNSPETPIFHKGRELYGLYECQKSLRVIEKIVVVEGYMDVIGLSQNGVEYSVASMGTATTDDHFTRLFRLSDSICFCYDGDQAGYLAAWRALENSLHHLKDGRQIKFVFLPDGEDPDSYIRNNSTGDFEKLLRNGKDLSDFLIQRTSENIDLKSVDGKARLAERAKPLINRIPRGVFKELIIEKLSALVGLSAKKLKQSISEDSSPKTRKPFSNYTPRRKNLNMNQSGPSVIKKSISLILNYPEAVEHIGEIEFVNYQKPGINILFKLMQNIKDEPNMNTAKLIERWREDDEGKHLSKLAINSFPNNEDFNAAIELNNCLAQITKNFYNERINSLIKKQTDSQLTSNEKAELKDIIHKNKIKR